MDCSMPGFPVLHYLPEFAQTRFHCVSDAIQPSHHLSPPSSPALSPSHQMAKGLELQLKHQSFQWMFRVDFLEEVKNINSKMRNYDLDGIFITSPIYTKLSQMVKDLPATRETWIRSLGWEDPLEKGMVTHSSILTWRIPWTENLGRLYSP